MISKDMAPPADGETVDMPEFGSDAWMNPSEEEYMKFEGMSQLPPKNIKDFLGTREK